MAVAKRQNPQELSSKESMKVVRDLLKTRAGRLKESDFVPGNVLMYYYDAKDKTQTYDKTPLVLILKRNKTHTLGINLHWAPIPLRVTLVKKILKANSKTPAKEPLVFNYGKLKPFLKRLGFAPIIRLYINKRISRRGVVIPRHQLMDVARTKSETFTQGKVSAETLYRRALKKHKEYRQTRKRRE